jgi:hypothetical protein
MDISVSFGYFQSSSSYRTLTQIPQPMHNSSEMNAIFEAGVTSMQSLPVTLCQSSQRKTTLPILTTGHDFLHS